MKPISMNEVRFRGWYTDEEISKMYYDVQKAYDYFFDIPATSFGQILSNPDNWKVMQDTGLHDRNGKKIWVGDIVTVGRELGGQNSHKHIVIYDYELLSYLERKPSTIIEVIGNIYEHSDLLT